MILRKDELALQGVIRAGVESQRPMWSGVWDRCDAVGLSASSLQLQMHRTVSYARVWTFCTPRRGLLGFCSTSSRSVASVRAARVQDATIRWKAVRRRTSDRPTERRYTAQTELGRSLWSTPVTAAVKTLSESHWHQVVKERPFEMYPLLEWLGYYTYTFTCRKPKLHVYI